VPVGHILKTPRKTTKPSRNIVGAQLRALRREARPRISQEDLCGRLATKGISLTRTQVAKIEAGRRPVFDYELVALAAVLRVPLESLLAPGAKK
jgi:transcriptional regulator with XRE-family HTH domain